MINLPFLSKWPKAILIFLSTIFLIILSHSSWAVQSVDWGKADPDGIFINEPTTVTVTAQVGVDPALIPTSVYLIKYNETFRPVANLGRLYDDGTHGDSLPGDNIFTTQIVVNEPSPTTINFKVTVAYRGTLRRVQSDFFSTNVVELPPEEEVNEILSTSQQASDNLELWSQQYGIDQAREMIANYLSTQPNVQDAGISEDGQTIWIVYDNGLEGAILANPEETLGYPSSNTGIVFSPLPGLDPSPILRAGAEAEVVNVYNRLNNDTCVSPAPIRRDNEVSVDFLKTLSQYGVISFMTHGGLDGNNNIIFQSGEQATTFLGIPTSHFIDWLLGRIIIGNDNYWLIRPSFIRHYAKNNKYPDSIIFLSMCHSRDNNTLSSAFIDNGAKTVFGWQNSVTVGFTRQTKENLLAQMIDNDRTTGEAFNNVPRIDTSITPNAILSMAGDADMKLPVDLVVNGSFETGNFTGWTRGQIYGCDFPQYAGPSGPYEAVVTGNATDGNWSARIGKWTQVYTGGLHGPPMPGEEPCGYNYIYQDIEVPQGNPTLTFSYNVQEYDTAVWSWFDMFIKNPTTGNNLATVINRAGKPGYNYGVYWNGGWQNVTYDLTPWAGQTIRLWFGVRQDGWGDQIATWVDEVSIGCE
jgi:hypothetical protein